MNESIIGYLYNGNIFDSHQFPIAYPHLVNDEKIHKIKINDFLGIGIMRHSLAHLMAQAIKQLFHNVCFGIGPVTDHGCFYDVKLENQLNDKDLRNIEKKMYSLIDKNIPIKYNQKTKSEITNIFQHDHLKKKILENINQDILSVYEQEEFMDLCKGPHVRSTGQITKFFKITHVEVLLDGTQRVYCVSFLEKEHLNKYLNNSKDHRQIIENMNLAFFNPISPAMVFWQAKGIQLVENIMSIVRKNTKDFFEIVTPPMANNKLWNMTGHMQEYKENMFVMPDDNCALKPMNCPLHAIYFQHQSRSYKDLPFRVSEFGKVFRNEFNGGLIGLKRLQYFTQDDGHIFCTMEQCAQEIEKFIESVISIYSALGLKGHGDFPDFIFQLSTSEKHPDSNKILQDILEKKNIIYTINTNDGAFYGPKIEIHIKDHNFKYWQCGTIQVDMSICKKLDVTYIDSNDAKQYPVVLHRAILGSIERFLGIFLESYEMPFYLHPVQIVILSVNENNIEKVQQLKNILGDFRVITDTSNNSINKKIRIHSKSQIPYVIVVGEKESNSDILTVRYKNQLEEIPRDEFLKKLTLLNRNSM